MDEMVIQRSNKQQRAAAGSSAAVEPAGRGRWRRAWPGERRRPWRGLCSTRAARGPKCGPGLFLRPLGTVIAARLASAQQRATQRDLDRGNRGRWRPAKRELRWRGLCATREKRTWLVLAAPGNGALQRAWHRHANWQLGGLCLRPGGDDTQQNEREHPIEMRLGK